MLEETPEGPSRAASGKPSPLYELMGQNDLDLVQLSSNKNMEATPMLLMSMQWASMFGVTKRRSLSTIPRWRPRRYGLLVSIDPSLPPPPLFLLPARRHCMSYSPQGLLSTERETPSNTQGHTRCNGIIRFCAIQTLPRSSNSDRHTAKRLLCLQ